MAKDFQWTAFIPFESEVSLARGGSSSPETMIEPFLAQLGSLKRREVGNFRKFRTLQVYEGPSLSLPPSNPLAKHLKSLEEEFAAHSVWPQFALQFELETGEGVDEAKQLAPATVQRWVTLPGMYLGLSEGIDQPWVIAVADGPKAEAVVQVWLPHVVLAVNKVEQQEKLFTESKKPLLHKLTTEIREHTQSTVFTTPDKCRPAELRDGAVNLNRRLLDLKERIRATSQELQMLETNRDDLERLGSKCNEPEVWKEWVRELSDVPLARVRHELASAGALEAEAEGNLEIIERERQFREDETQRRQSWLFALIASAGLASLVPAKEFFNLTNGAAEEWRYKLLVAGFAFGLWMVISLWNQGRRGS